MSVLHGGRRKGFPAHTVTRKSAPLFPGGRHNVLVRYSRGACGSGVDLHHRISSRRSFVDLVDRNGSRFSRRTGRVLSNDRTCIDCRGEVPRLDKRGILAAPRRTARHSLYPTASPLPLRPPLSLHLHRSPLRPPRSIRGSIATPKATRETSGQTHWDVIGFVAEQYALLRGVETPASGWCQPKGTKTSLTLCGRGACGVYNRFSGAEGHGAV